MCCCGCALIVLEPGAGFGSWRALFGFGAERKRSSMKAADVATERVISGAPGRIPGGKPNSGSIEERLDRIVTIESNMGDRT
jgi:hypothetical protein